jgi:hypothetical protein
MSIGYWWEDEKEEHRYEDQDMVLRWISKR